MSIIKCMNDLVCMYRLVQIANQSFLVISSDEIGKQFVEKYKKYDYIIFQRTLKMAAAEGYVKVYKRGFSHNGIKRTTEFVEVTNPKGVRFLSWLGFFEELLGAYSKTAQFISGGLFVAFIGFLAYILPPIISWVGSLFHLH